MSEYTGGTSQAQAILSIRHSLAITLVLSVLLTACAGVQAVQPGMLEASTGMSSSLRSQQELPKSDDSVPAAPMTGSSIPDDGEVEETSNQQQTSDPLGFPEKGGDDSANAEVVAPALPPTPTSTEAVVAPPAPPPADASIPFGPQIGYRAPDFTLQTLDGGTIALSDLLGKPVLINYWATWCVPCKEELPILEKLYQEYQPQGLVVISVDAIEQDTPEKLQAVINQIGMTFPTLLDQGNQFSSAYQAIFFPTSFFIDASGVIRDLTLGSSSEAVFRQKIERLLSGAF